METKNKDPQDELDYTFDWTDWLATGETISDYTVTVPQGLTVGTGAKATSESSGIVTVWLSGGTLGEIYTLVCNIETNAGRKKDWSGKILIKHN